jgi:tetratricopeptide (TPR) repeat protein
MESLLRHTPATGSSQKEAQAAAEGYAAPETAALTAKDGGGGSLEESLKTSLPEPVENREATAASAEKNKNSRIKVETGETGLTEAASSTARPNAGARRLWQAAALALLLIAVGATALAFYYSRSKGSGETSGEAPISISDQKRRVEEKLMEAERLLSEGNVTDAIARLRYAVKLDPSNARAHRMLADALERAGNVNEAIDEYRAATENDPGNEETRLLYADALRRVGRTEEAREIYQKLSSSSSEEVARTAKEKLAQMPAAAPPSSNSEQSRDARAQNRAGEGEATASDNGVASNGSTPGAPTNRDDGGKSSGDPVASYNRAMKIIEGKDIKKMNRADLILAYTLFQYAQKGPNAADASRHLRELDNELFVRRKRNQ